MKKVETTYYLALFLMADIIIVGIMLCFFSQRSWWNNWMVTAPNLYMVLGALFCPMMKRYKYKKNAKMTWLLVFKGIKIVLTAIMVALYIWMVKANAKAFVLVTAICYFIGLIIETYCLLHYMKQKAA